MGRRVFLSFLGLIVLGVGLLGFRLKDRFFEIAKALDIMAAVYRDLNTYYVDSVDASELMETGIQAMTSSLDPYTTYYPEEDRSLLDFQLTGKYAGVGALFQIVEDSIILSSTIEGGPFDKAGLIPGDIILSLDGEPVSGKNSDEVHELLKGEPRTVVRVKYKRPWTQKIFNKRVKREALAVPNIPYSVVLKDGLAYIRFEQFTKGSYLDLKSKIEEFKRENPDLRGLILDLRDNPGGLLSEAAKIGNLFLPLGDTIVSVKGRATAWNRIYRAEQNPLDTVLPLALLINERSASASEVVAGAIQDLDRGVIIGKNSFGKGLVQSTRDLPYNSKLKFTVARYYTPSGRSIQAINYGEKDHYGSPVRVSESMKKQFSTSDGRKVLDHGGIAPDQVIENRPVGNVEGSLLNNNKFFLFATQYTFYHKKKPPLSHFEVSDSLFSTFSQYLKDNPVEEEESLVGFILSQFEYNAQKEGIFDSVKTSYEQLKKEVEAQSGLSLEDSREEVSQSLAESIMYSYYGPAGQIATSLDTDPAILEASKILTNDSLYHAILGK